MKVRPGQMVAVDLSTVSPEIAWRWYRGRVLEAAPEGVSVDHRGGRKLSAMRVPGLESDLEAGVEVWVTGMEGTWEIHDRVSGDVPAHPDRLRERVIPRITALLSAAPRE